MKTLTLHLLVSILFWVSTIENLAFANEVSEREFQIKAGFIYNFAHYSHLASPPELAKSRYVICTWDPSFLSVAQEVLHGRSIDNRPVVLLQLKTTQLNDATCDAVYVMPSDPFPSLQPKASEQPPLLIGDTDEFMRQGGHIRFFYVGGKVRFEVAPDRLKAAGILMSSKVLRLGRIYQG